jgi:hypothetical protein
MAPIPTSSGTEPWDIGASLVESRGESESARQRSKASNQNTEKLVKDWCQVTFY